MPKDYPVTIKTEVYNDNTGYVYAGTQMNQNWSGGVAINQTGGFLQLVGSYPFYKNEEETHKMSFGTRTRFHVNNLWNDNQVTTNIKERLALHNTVNVGSGVSLYQIVGANINVPLSQNGHVSIAPTAVLGMDKTFKDKTANCNYKVYGEYYPFDRNVCVGFSLTF